MEDSMNPTHVGSFPNGRRMHLTDAKGWSACSRRTTDLVRIDQCNFKVDDPWCSVCLEQTVVHGAESIQVFGIEGLRREEGIFAEWNFRRAMVIVADGYREALLTSGLSADHRAALVELMEKTNLLANRDARHGVDPDGWPVDQEGGA